MDAKHTCTRHANMLHYQNLKWLMQQQCSQNKPAETTAIFSNKRKPHTPTHTHRAAQMLTTLPGEARHGGGNVSDKSGFKSLHERKETGEERTDFSSDQAVY